MSRKEPFKALEQELVGEKAAALGRIAARMEAALAALRAFDDAAALGASPTDAARDDLVAAAAESVWFYIVQRDVLGWHRHDEALRVYRVPAEILARIGPRPRKL